MVDPAWLPDPYDHLVTDLASLGVVDAAAMLGGRKASSSELTAACLDRIREVDGTHSHEGDPDSINAWVRVYEDEAVAAAAQADERLSARAVQRDGPAHVLTGVPVGLEDLYAVAGKPVTASSRLLDDVPAEDCDVWRRLRSAGMVLLGHLHTHEFAAGGTTDQVGSPWDLQRSAGGSSGGSAAALAARMTPAATGTDTAGSLRIPSACCGTSTVKPTRGRVSLAGVVPLSWTLDHAGPMARSLADCDLLLRAMAGVQARALCIAQYRNGETPMRSGLIFADGDCNQVALRTTRHRKRYGIGRWRARPTHHQRGKRGRRGQCHHHRDADSFHRVPCLRTSP